MLIRAFAETAFKHSLDLYMQAALPSWLLSVSKYSAAMYEWTYLLVMLGFDSVYEVLRQLCRLAEALGDAGGDVDVQGVALLGCPTPCRAA